MFELIQHTADVRLLVTADSAEDLFRDAVQGMYAVMRGEVDGGEPVQRVITVDESPNRTTLLIDFLNEVLNRAQIARELFDEIHFTRFEETSLTAELRGRKPAEFEEDVKAVTYHEADVREQQGVWVTMLVFDL